MSLPFPDVPRFPAVPAAYHALFVQQIDDHIVALDEIDMTRDADALHRWLHKLSGGLAILGPSMLLEACKTRPESDEHLVSLRNELIAMRDQLQAAPI